MAEEEKVIGQTVVADGLHRVGKGPTPEWVLVPREPTEAMLGAAWDGTVNWRRLVETADDADMAPLYRAMIAAAPVAEKPDPNPEWEALADETHTSIRAELEPFCMEDARQVLTMFKTWKSHAEPASENGLISFSRAMMDSAQDALEFLVGEQADWVRLSDARRAVDACGGTHPPGQEEYGRGYDAALTEADAALVRLGQECVR